MPVAFGETNSWTGIRETIHRRIRDRVWQPGEQIPHEAVLAEEFGCARTTVNRALRDLADRGLVVRKRKAGTRVAVNPPNRATITIPVIREEVETTGRRHRHRVIVREERAVPPLLHGAFPVPSNEQVLFLKTLHFADERPYLYEVRYLNLGAVPRASEHDFETVSVNEWLVRNAMYSHGELSFFSLSADHELAEIFGTTAQTALFALERITWSDTVPITHVRLVYEPGYRMRTRF